MVKLLMQTVCKYLKNLKFYHPVQVQSDTQKIKHHLYGAISVKRYFSAGDWLKQAKKINFCLKKKKFQ